MTQDNATETRVRDAALIRDRVAAQLRITTRNLHEAIREAKAAGATVSQLEVWSGYSRRRVFQILQR